METFVCICIYWQYRYKRFCVARFVLRITFEFISKVKIVLTTLVFCYRLYYTQSYIYKDRESIINDLRFKSFLKKRLVKLRIKRHPLFQRRLLTKSKRHLK